LASSCSAPHPLLSCAEEEETELGRRVRAYKDEYYFKRRSPHISSSLNINVDNI
jgi:hypothetical protein